MCMLRTSSSLDIDMLPRTEATALLMHMGEGVLRRVLDTMRSVLISESSHLIGELRDCYTSMTALLRAMAKFVPGKETDGYVDDHDEEEGDQLENETAPTLQRVQRRHGRISRDDVKVVVARLGMVMRPSEEEEEEEEGGEGEALDALLEEKHASMEELREAFYVFDKNEDGFITTGELWCVMRRLGLQEGVRLDDCERMIRAYDEDGDGKISFGEFRTLMENAT